MLRSPSNIARSVVPWILAAALLMVAGVAITRIVQLRAEVQNQVTREFKEEIAGTVEAWEDTLLERLDTWMEAVDTSPDNPYRLQNQLRSQKPWFDSLYVWRPPRRISLRGKIHISEPELLFPVPPPPEDRGFVRAHPCMSTARLLTMMPVVDEQRVANAYLKGCRGEPPNVQLVAASEAAAMFTRIGRYQEALEALESPAMDEDLALQELSSRQIPAFRVVTQRIQRSSILLQLNREDEALELLYQTGLEITELDAPEVEPLLHRVHWPILRELRVHNRKLEKARLEMLVTRSDRRVKAWHEVRDRIMPRSTPISTEPNRFIYDQYNETPFLLYYGPVVGGRLGVALQLDQSLLLGDFLASVRRGREHIVVTDAKGAWVAGARPRGQPIEAQESFTRTLSHLRVGFYRDAIDARVSTFDDQWVLPLVITLFCVFLGLLALTSEVRASRRLRELLQRQRDFTTRVTHELKTPLAGIRVMAENLESGAWRNEEQRDRMARRIVDEADRLARRVDEILVVARERTIPEPKLFDPEEVLLEAIDVWGPRLEQAGVSLQADLDLAPEILGDAVAVRDAVSCLLDNALKYHDPSRKDPRVWLNLLQDGSDAVIEVIDNGIGVPPKLRKSIFERFVRVEGPNRGKSGGHGLGLAQVAEIVRLHGGNVQCLPGVDGGAKFVLRLKGT